MPRFRYTLTGVIDAPEGTVTPDGGCLQMPDEDGKSRIFKLWEAWELNIVGADEDADNHRDLSFDEMSDMGLHYDGDTASFEEIEA